jgi:drug/metabolite transporter (DMT)-like permease
MGWRLALALIFVMLLNASCYPLITIGLKSAPHLSFATLRAFIAGLALALVAALLRCPVPRALTTWLGLGAIGLGTTSLGYLGMFHAAEFVSPGLATVIGNSQPLIAAILAHVFLRERLRLVQHLGLSLGFLGIIVISLPQLAGSSGGARFAVGFAYIIFAAGGGAVGNVVMKALGGRVDPLVAMAAQSFFGAIPLAAAAALREQPLAITWSSTFIVSLLGLALLTTALTNWLWFTLLGRVALSRANAFTFLTPFIGFSLGVAFFGEHTRIAAIAGLSLTAAGIGLVERAPLADRRKPAAGVDAPRP